MTKRWRRPATWAIGAVMMGSVQLVTAGASARAADDYGQHVRTCAQEMGFSGDHNPGMHNGRSGWSSDHTC